MSQDIEQGPLDSSTVPYFSRELHRYQDMGVFMTRIDDVRLSQNIGIVIPNDSHQFFEGIAEIFLEGLLSFLDILNGMYLEFNHTGSRIAM